MIDPGCHPRGEPTAAAETPTPPTGFTATAAGFTPTTPAGVEPPIAALTRSGAPTRETGATASATASDGADRRDEDDNGPDAVLAAARTREASGAATPPTAAGPADRRDGEPAEDDPVPSPVRRDGEPAEDRAPASEDDSPWPPPRPPWLSAAAVPAPTLNAAPANTPKPNAPAPNQAYGCRARRPRRPRPPERTGAADSCDRSSTAEPAPREPNTPSETIGTTRPSHVDPPRLLVGPGPNAWIRETHKS
jgi:hypothetical protein